MCVRSKQYWSNRFCAFTTINEKYGLVWILPMYICLENVGTSTGNSFHGRINTAIRLKQMAFPDGICKMCGSHEEIVEHLLYICSKLFGIWEDIVQLISNVFETRITLNRFSVQSGILINDETIAIVTVFISGARFKIWKRKKMFR